MLTDRRREGRGLGRGKERREGGGGSWEGRRWCVEETRARRLWQHRSLAPRARLRDQRLNRQRTQRRGEKQAAGGGFAAGAAAEGGGGGAGDGAGFALYSCPSLSIPECALRSPV